MHVRWATTFVLLSLTLACAQEPRATEAEVDCTHEQTRDTDPDCWPSSRELLLGAP